MKTILKSISLFLLFSLVSCKEEPTTQRVEPIVKARYTKDGITIKSYDYEGLRPFLEQENDTLYVVNFWATWCQPCIEELPNFEKLATAYKNQPVKVVLVSLDMPKTIESKLIPFIQKHAIQSEVVLLDDKDANTWIEKIDSTWSGAIPATIFYKKEQRVFLEKTFTYEELKKEIEHFK